MAGPHSGDEAATHPQSGDGAHHLHFSYARHPRAENRGGAVKVSDQHPRHNLAARLNTRVAVAITVAVGSMWCAYLFTVLALVSAPSAFSSGQQLVIVSWIAQTFLQLVLLPIIIVGQNVQAQAADARSQQTYDDAEAILHDCLQLQRHLEAQDAILNRALAHLERLSAPSA